MRPALVGECDDEWTAVAGPAGSPDVADACLVGVLLDTLLLFALPVCVRSPELFLSICGRGPRVLLLCF